MRRPTPSRHRDARTHWLGEPSVSVAEPRIGRGGCERAPTMAPTNQWCREHVSNRCRTLVHTPLRTHFDVTSTPEILGHTPFRTHFDVTSTLELASNDPFWGFEP